MPLVQAKCINCGGILEVDNTKDAAICKFCGTPFVVKEAINNFYNTLNVDNANINIIQDNIHNLLLRAIEFEEKGDIEQAEKYYNRILDIDIANNEAKERLNRILTTINHPNISVRIKMSQQDTSIPSNLTVLLDNIQVEHIGLDDKPPVEGIYFIFAPVGTHTISCKIGDVISNSIIVEVSSNKQYYGITATVTYSTTGFFTKKTIYSCSLSLTKEI